MTRFFWILGLLLMTHACSTSPAPDQPDAALPDGGEPDAAEPDAGLISNFELNYGDFTETHWGYALTENHQGNLMVTGRTSGFGAGGDDYFLAEINRQGQMQRVRTFGSALDERGTGIVKTADGFILSGWGYHDDHVRTCQLLRLDETGALQDATKLLVSVESVTESTVCLHTLDMGSRGFVAAGDIGGVSGVIVHRFDQQAAHLWSKAYDMGTATYAQAIYELSDESLLVVGNTKRFDPKSDGYLLKLSADGTPQWSVTYGIEDLHEGFAGATQLSNGTVVVAGTIARQIEDSEWTFLGGLLVRIDPETGTVIASHRYEPAAVAYSSVLINRIEDDRFVVSGMAMEHEDWTSSVIEFDADFNFIAEHRYGEQAEPEATSSGKTEMPPPPAPGDEQPVFYHRLDGGGYLLGGVSLGSFTFSDSSWLIATDGSNAGLCHVQNGVSELVLADANRPTRELVTAVTIPTVTEIATDFDAHERQGMLSDNSCQTSDDPLLLSLDSGLGVEVVWQDNSDVDVHLLYPDAEWGDPVLDCNAYNHSPDWGTTGYLHNPIMLLSSDDGSKGGLEQIAIVPENNKTYRIGLSLERGEASIVVVRVLKEGVPISEQSVTLSPETPFIDLTGVHWPDGTLVE